MNEKSTSEDKDCTRSAGWYHSHDGRRTLLYRYIKSDFSIDGSAEKANQHILSGHLHSCVLTAIEERDAEEKVSEIEAVIAALLK